MAIIRMRDRGRRTVDRGQPVGGIVSIFVDPVRKQIVVVIPGIGYILDSGQALQGIVGVDKVCLAWRDGQGRPVTII
jgi:hypothetical protein